jgi:hypothetical protein
VIDRIVSDKTFWNATFSRSFLKKIFRDLRAKAGTTPGKRAHSLKQTQQLSSLCLLAMVPPSLRMIPGGASGYTIFSASSFTWDAAVLS